MTATTKPPRKRASRPPTRAARPDPAKTPFLSVSAAAKLLHWHPTTVLTGIEAGTFPVEAVRKGQRWVLPTTALLEVLDGRLPKKAAFLTRP